MKKILLAISSTIFCLFFVMCSDGHDDAFKEDSESPQYSVSFTYTKASQQGKITYYKVTVHVHGASPADVNAMGVYWQKENETKQIKEAGTRVTSATCQISTTPGTYYIWAYANVNGTRCQSSKKAIKVK